jgi:hypothetical protein
VGFAGIDFHADPSLVSSEISLRSSSCSNAHRYNSVIYDTTSANFYVTAFVTPSFLQGEPFNQTRFDRISYKPDPSKVPQLLSHLQSTAESFTRLNNTQCFDAYSTPFISEWGNVLLISHDDIPHGDPVLFLYNQPRSLRFDIAFGPSFSFLCISGGPVGDLTYVRDNIINWKFPGNASEDLTYYDPSFYGCGIDYTGPPPLLPVDHCLAQKVDQCGAIRINIILLAVVAACNLIKATCMVLSFFKIDPYPLMTIGDAIASYLTVEDEETLGRSEMNAEHLQLMATTVLRRRMPVLLGSNESGLMWPIGPQRYLRAMSTFRWLGYMSL